MVLGLLAPPNRGVPEAAGCDEGVLDAPRAELVLGAPKLSDGVGAAFEEAGAAPNRPGFAAAPGGGPAGVVEGIENSGFDGVVAPSVAPELAPANKPPDEGAAEVAPGAAAPNKEGVGALGVVEGVAAEPNNPPDAGAGLAALPKRPPLLLLAAPNIGVPDGAAGVGAVFAGLAPNKDDVCPVVVELAFPKRPPVLGWATPVAGAGVDDVLPKLKVGLLAPAVPNKLPEAGAEVPAAAPGVPKLKGADIFTVPRAETKESLPQQVK